MLQKFAMVKYGVFVAKICKHALCASTVRDIWWSPLAHQLLPPCFRPPHLVHLLVDRYVVVDPLVVVVHSHCQSLLGWLLTNNVVVQVLVNFLGVRGWLSACLLP